MNSNDKPSQLVETLRGAVAVIQMILFKEVRNNLASRHPDLEPSFRLMLAGIITNEVFGTRNPQEKFENFRKENMGLIEQELLSLRDEHTQLCAHLTDALRIQALCDHQEGNQATDFLLHAKKIGILDEDREVPLPSSFMTMVRELGAEHNLIVPPNPDENSQSQKIIH